MTDKMRSVAIGNHKLNNIRTKIGDLEQQLAAEQARAAALSNDTAAADARVDALTTKLSDAE